ncbi:MAG: methyltransferase domain-containing protein [Candidatus Magasanikbacteria bacterium]
MIIPILKDKIYNGLVALCHFEPFDDVDGIKKLTTVLIKKANNKQIILVPFAHLHDKVAPVTEANNLFNILINKVKIKYPNTEFAPFGVEKELNISIDKKDALVSFLNFKPTYLNEVRRLYDVYAQNYDAHMMETGHYDAQEKIYNNIKSNIQEPILDLASGPGFLLKKMSKDFSEVYANDISEVMIEFAKNRIKKDTIKFSKDNVITLNSYKDIKFGTIFSTNLFYYIKDRERNKAIKCWKKLLKKDGNLIFIEEYPFVDTESKFFKGKKDGITNILSPIPPEELIALLEHYGFKFKLKIKTPIDKRHNLYGLVFSL